jgi:hypothetical protein
MKRISAKTWLILAFLLIFLGLAAAATTIFREFVRDQLVIPLLDALHYLRQFVEAIDSDLVWGIFILIIFAWMLLSLPSLGRSALKTGIYSDKHSRSGRLEHWLREVRVLQNERHFTRYATLELKKLILSTVAFRQQCSLRQAEQWLDAPENQRRIPSEIKLLLHAEPANQTRPNTIWQALKFRLLGYPTLPQTSDKIDLEPILRFLETENIKDYQPNRPNRQ